MHPGPTLTPHPPQTGTACYILGSSILLGGCLTCVVDIIKPGTLFINVWDINAWRPFLTEELGIDANRIVGPPSSDNVLRTGTGAVTGAGASAAAGGAVGTGAVASGAVGAGASDGSQSRAIVERLIQDGLVARGDVERVTREIEQGGDGVSDRAEDRLAAAAGARPRSQTASSKGGFGRGPTSTGSGSPKSPRSRSPFSMMSRGKKNGKGGKVNGKGKGKQGRDGQGGAYDAVPTGSGSSAV